MAERPEFRLLVAGVKWPPETFLGRLFRGLADAGVEVTVACDYMPPEDRRAHPRIRWLPAPSWSGPAPLRLLRLGRMGARAALRGPHDLRRMAGAMTRSGNGLGGLSTWNRLLPFAGRRWDIVYFPWNSGAISHLPLFSLVGPAVLSCRGTQIHSAPHNPERQSIRTGLSWSFQYAAAVHCVSEATRLEAEAYGLDRSKAWVIHPAVDTDVFKPANRRSTAEGLRLVMVGSLLWVKGYEYALQAVRGVVDQGIEVSLDIIGDGPERQRLLYTIDDLGLKGRVRLLGRLAPDRVVACLQQADVFLLSSVSEGISNAVLEGMACGLPVVTTDCGGMREAVTDGVEGFLVPVREPDAMPRAVARLAADPALRQRMGLAARQRVLRQFALGDQVDQWLALYRDVLGAKPVRRIQPCVC